MDLFKRFRGREPQLDAIWSITALRADHSVKICLIDEKAPETVPYLFWRPAGGWSTMRQPDGAGINAGASGTAQA